MRTNVPGDDSAALTAPLRTAWIFPGEFAIDNSRESVAGGCQVTRQIIIMLTPRDQMRPINLDEADGIAKSQHEVKILGIHKFSGVSLNVEKGIAADDRQARSKRTMPPVRGKIVSERCAP